MNLATAWKLTTRIAAAIGVLLLLFASFELIRIFVFLYRLRPALGWTFAGSIVVAFLGMLYYVMAHWLAFPPRLRPPRQPPLTEASHPELKRAALYRIARLRLMTGNPLISDSSRAILTDQMDTFDGLIHHHPLNEDLIRIIQKCDGEILPPIHAELWDAATPVVREHIRQVMLREITGPGHASHPAAFFFQRAKLIDQILHVHDPLPAIRHRLECICDVFRAGRRELYADLECQLVDQLHAQSIPREIAAACAVGLHASFDAQITWQRCTTCHPWISEPDQGKLVTLLTAALPDVKATLIEQILPATQHCFTLNSTSGSAPGSDTVMKSAREGVMKAFHAVGKDSEKTIIRPTPAPAPLRRTEPPMARSTPPPSPAHHVRAHTTPQLGQHNRRRVKRRRGIARILHLLRQRIQYTSGLGGK